MSKDEYIIKYGCFFSELIKEMSTLIALANMFTRTTLLQCYLYCKLYLIWKDEQLFTKKVNKCFKRAITVSSIDVMITYLNIHFS